MKLKLKYKVNQSKEAGIFYLFGAIINLLILLFTVNQTWDVISHIKVLTIPFIIVVLFILWFIVIGVYFLKLNTIDYMRIDNNKLSIHRGLYRPRKVINIEEIEKGFINSDKFILILHSKKEIEIYIKNLLNKDFEILTMQLSNSILISKNNDFIYN